MVLTYYPMFMAKETKDWPEKKMRNWQWLLLGQMHHFLNKVDLRKVLKIFQAPPPFIRAVAVKSKWAGG